MHMRRYIVYNSGAATPGGGGALGRGVPLARLRVSTRNDSSPKPQPGSGRTERRAGYERCAVHGNRTAAGRRDSRMTYLFKRASTVHSISNADYRTTRSVLDRASRCGVGDTAPEPRRAC